MIDKLDKLKMREYKKITNVYLVINKQIGIIRFSFKSEINNSIKQLR